jgi:hypothetical protein
MAKRSPMATGGEGRGSKPARQGPGGLSPKLKGVLKAGGKMAAEEIAMTALPAARIRQLKKVLDSLGKSAGRSEVGKALKKGGFELFATTKPSRAEVERAYRRVSKPKASQRSVPPAPVGPTPKRTEGFVDSTDGFDAVTRADLKEIPEMASKLRKLRGRTMTTSPRGGNMTVEILPNDLMLVTNPKTQTETRLRGKVRAGGKVLEWVPAVTGGRFNRQAIQEINDKFGVNLVPSARVQREMRKAAEAKAKK